MLHAGHDDVADSYGARDRKALKARERGSVDRSAEKDSAGKARGHASLMRPAEPVPGVPFVVFGRYAQVRTYTVAVSGSCCGGGVIEPPFAVDFRVSRDATARMLLLSSRAVKLEPGREGVDFVSSLRLFLPKSHVTPRVYV